MRAWIYLGAIALLTILVVQNWQPVVPLRFLGQQTPALPLAAWILVAALSGIVAGQCLLWLTAEAPVARPTPRSQPPEPELDPSMRPPQDEPEPDTSDVEDWFSEPGPAPREPEIEVQDRPRPSAPYAYQYRPSRKATAKAPPPPEEVVDAEYRILTPPPPKDSTPQDDEDWDIPL
ncbi:hypothetical protein NBE99_01160 [Thermosynechococcus sp. HN-54]|uniref:hypothetical protein n=1 Tax=Thermosynechococcus sp. HN-54 TaxID=2933959 RepID=UPI00202CDD2E|nr:hypothetical protein [Thermosynechococcus sp. HN-54]URR35769.1 hypothetical protein NBE99_01160 [Thermosynechococcus sp. HN-54]